MTTNTENLRDKVVRDICSVSVTGASKSEVRRIIEAYTNSLLEEIEGEVKDVDTNKFEDGLQYWEMRGMNASNALFREILKKNKIK